MLSRRKFRQMLDRASREVDSMAVWRSLSIEDQEKALRLLIGRNWRSLYKPTIDQYTAHIDAQFR